MALGYHAGQRHAPGAAQTGRGKPLVPANPGNSTESETGTVPIKFLTTDFGDLLGLPALQAFIGRVQNQLVLPAFFSGNGEFAVPFDGGGKHIYLAGVSIAIGDRLGLHDNSSPA